jgi:predicted nucleic acid-binding protein
LANQVCIDASFGVALLVPERFNLAALQLWEVWIKEDAEIITPGLFTYEVTSALYRKAFRRLISWSDVHEILMNFTQLQITSYNDHSLVERAVELAKEFQRPNTYDAFYLALAERQDCPFWTADERLFNAIHSKLSLAHWLGEVSETG